MSDREGRGGPTDDELSLPRATVAKMIQGTKSSSDVSFHSLSLPAFSQYLHPPASRDRLELTLLSLPYPSESRRERSEILPEDVTCAKDTRDLVIECCVGKKLKFLNIPVALMLTPPFLIQSSSISSLQRRTRYVKRNLRRR